MSTTMNPSSIRKQNMKQIIKTLRNTDQLLSRAQISREISLSAPSVSKIINILIEEYILEEIKEGSAGKTGGRKPILLEINEKCSYLMGVYIENGTITLVLSDFNGNIVDTVDMEYDEEREFSRITYLIHKVEELLQKHNINKEKLLFIGISVPGVFDSRKGIIKLAPNIKDWEDIPVKDKLKEYFNCQVIVENAVNMAVLGERWKGKINGCDNAIYINVDKGIGAGILIDGEIYKGYNDIAGEIGFMVSDKDYISHEDDNYGSLEKVCSLKFILKKAEQLLNKEDVTLEDIVSALEEGNDDIEKMLKEVCQQLAITIANIICVLNPEEIVMGGRFIKVAVEFEDYINQMIEQIVPSAPDIVFSELGRKVFYLGSIVRGLDNIEDNLINYYFGD